MPVSGKHVDDVEGDSVKQRLSTGLHSIHPSILQYLKLPLHEQFSTVSGHSMCKHQANWI